jgi:hypothetical protein
MMPIEPEILDPKLRAALDEIETVLRKHQVAGNVVLASSTHAAFRLIFPEWSGIRLEGVDRVRIKLKSADPEHAAASLHLVLSLRDLSLTQALSVDLVAKTVLGELQRRGIEVDHEMFGGPEPEAKT